MRKWITTADDYDPSHPPTLIRRGVRAAIFKDDKVCLLHYKKFDHYTLPGGGIEESETKEAALKREVKEETGFEINEFEPVLELEERFFDSIWVHTFYFSTINDKMHEVEWTKEEQTYGITIQWVPLTEALTLLSEHQGAHPYSENIMTREFLGLSEAINHLKTHS